MIDQSYRNIFDILVTVPIYGYRDGTVRVTPEEARREEGIGDVIGTSVVGVTSRLDQYGDR